MLDAGTAPRRIGGLTVFGDHADPKLRYVLAEVPRVRTDPEPQISLLMFRGGPEGALLQLESHLAPTEEQLTAVTQALSSEGPAPRLVRPDFRAGAIHIAGWLEADELEPLSLFVGTPSLVGDPSSVLAARLDGPAAALAERALRGGNALPTALIYELEFLGLAGPLGIEAEADLQAIHDRLTAEGALNTPYGRARLAGTWEEFAKDNLIRLRVIDESGEVEGRRAEALTRVGNELVSSMFSPSPPAEAPPQLDDEPVAQIELSFRLTMRREELATTSRWSYLERSARRITHHAAASLIGVLGDRPASAHVFYADLAPRAGEIVVRAEPELEALGIAALEVDLRLGEVGEPEEPETAPTFVHALTLTPLETEARIPIERDPTEPLHYRVRALFDPDKTHAPARQSEWLEALGNSVVVSARRLFPPRTLSVVAGHLELDWLDHIEVVVQPSIVEEPPRSLLLSDEQRSADAYFPAAGQGPLQLTAHYRGREGEPTRSEPAREIPLGEDLVVLDGPFGASISVLVVPLPLPRVLTAITELRLEHEGWEQTKSVSWDLPDSMPQRVGLRRLRDGPRTYQHRTTLIYGDGRVETSEWADTDAPTLVVGAEGPVSVHRTEVFILGGGPSGRGSLAIELTLAAGDSNTSVLVEGPTDRAELVLVSPADARPPVLGVREIMMSGRTHEQWFLEPPEHMVLMPPPPPPSPPPDPEAP